NILSHEYIVHSFVPYLFESHHTLDGHGTPTNMLGLKSLQTAKKVIARIEVMHIIKKGQTLQNEKFVQNHDLFGSTI
ncbi:hypothetical protein BAQ49_11285, partial [Bacillus proteolyticus]